MKNKKLIFSIMFILILVSIDQLSKYLILEGNGIFINDFFSIEISKNTGMAFGFNSGNFSNILLSIFVIIIVINFMKKQSELIDFKTNISLCLILAGAFGNLIDRFVRGGIIDFIRIYKFPIFNIADIFIVSGWILVVMFLIIFSGKNRGEIFEKQDENIRN